MSKNEDYLDNLLQSVTDYKKELNKKSDVNRAIISRELEDFTDFGDEDDIDDFMGDEDDEFLKDFEREMFGEEESLEEVVPDIESEESFAEDFSTLFGEEDASKEPPAADGGFGGEDLESALGVAMALAGEESGVSQDAPLTDSGADPTADFDAGDFATLDDLLAGESSTDAPSMGSEPEGLDVGDLAALDDLLAAGETAMDDSSTGTDLGESGLGADAHSTSPESEGLGSGVEELGLGSGEIEGLADLENLFADPVGEDSAAEGIDLPDGMVMPESPLDGVDDPFGAMDLPGGDDADLGDLLNGMDGDFGELSDLLKADEENIDIGGIMEGEEESMRDAMKQADAAGTDSYKPEGEKDAKEEENPGGILGKIKALINKFKNSMKLEDGWDEPIPVDDKPTGVPEAGTLAGISDENMDILKSLSDDQPAADAGGKKKKKEKKKKEKKPKEPKEKKEKKPKEKKEKKPKEKKPKEKMPPVPKGPLIACCVLGASMALLVYVFVNIVGSMVTYQTARSLFYKGDYLAAYGVFEGSPAVEGHEDLEQQIRLLALIAQQRDGFYYLQKQELYEDALDSLVRGVYRFDKYADEAMSLGIGEEFNSIEAEIETRLKDTFKLDRNKARELYSIRDRQSYTDEIFRIVRELGYHDNDGEE